MQKTLHFLFLFSLVIFTLNGKLNVEDIYKNTQVERKLFKYCNNLYSRLCSRN